ncbi:hypothetical protein KDK95_00620 [Actinospica sp. MGRD01-02]|uniref:Zinc-finger domain-containing protein n=1 Tax=Actinospica acidithermotolerans TaxID=2828514 RepID=A0A941EBF2_9ACTN|nr:hypothetical protein [Actinospica acidithermotolerans]MBR7824794.1 hypothetical protein [Actinospica acidithermotolerans]
MTEPQEPRGAAAAHLTPEELSECAFSPETAPAGLLEHAQGCPECAAELSGLRVLLSELAALPEPEVPESVVIRMDAAVQRAWQEADAEQERDKQRDRVGTASAARPGRWSWRKLAVPLASLSLIAIAGIGIGVAVSHSGSNASSTGSASSGVSVQNAPRSNQDLTDPALVAWVHSSLAGGQPKSSPMVAEGNCAQASAPKRSGYTVLTTAHRVFENQAATLVVYQNAQEPASSTVYAVVYAGSCPSSASVVLAQGSVSR